MPIFDYKCLECAHLFEKIVRNDETPACPSCSATKVERQLSLASISTQKTRKISSEEARATHQKGYKEHQHAQREYESNYHKDHS